MTAVAAAPRRTIDDQIVELLRDEGPTLTSDVRTKLCVASAQRFEVALLFLMEERTIERCSAGSESALRIVGDQRPVPETMTRFIERHTYRRSRISGSKS